MNAITVFAKIEPMISEYETKIEAAEETIKNFSDAITALEFNSSVQGEYSGVRLHTAMTPSVTTVKESITKSAWLHLLRSTNIERILPTSDRAAFDRSMENPPEFNMDNIRATFGDYIINPRYHVLRGLAEAFVNLDPAYKSHSKVKIGVKGLPKRVIFNGVLGWSASWSRERMVDALNALFLLQHKRQIRSYYDLEKYIENREEQEELDFQVLQNPDDKTYRPQLDLSGLTFKTFENDNVHVHFDKDTLTDINRALAEFYGDVLPDVEEEGDIKATSTAVAKDLQFYWTPAAVGRKLANELWKGKVLEPSCGEGHIMDAIRDYDEKGELDVVGYEFHSGRADVARSKGHKVVTANFLEVPPVAEFDYVVMNPPFYGQHYLKHIEHAMKFLKPDGLLISVLPATAWYDHKKLPKGADWRDLPVASFNESGTNVPTGIVKIRKAM